MRDIERFDLDIVIGLGDLLVQFHRHIVRAGEVVLLAHDVLLGELARAKVAAGQREHRHLILRGVKLIESARVCAGGVKQNEAFGVPEELDGLQENFVSVEKGKA